jgi:hypothetical protein
VTDALPFSTAAIVHQFRQNVGWAAFWATLSQTHLVTLPTYYPFINSYNIGNVKG